MSEIDPRKLFIDASSKSRECFLVERRFFHCVEHFHQSAHWDSESQLIFRDKWTRRWIKHSNKTTSSISFILSYRSSHN